MKVQVTLAVIGGLCSEALHKCGNEYIRDFFRTSIVNVCAKTAYNTENAHGELLCGGGENILELIEKSGKEYMVFSSSEEFMPEKSNMFENDEDMIEALISKEEKPDFTLVYLGNADKAGHTSGFMSEEYLKAVSGCFDNIKKIRDAFPFHKLMVISDRGGHDKVHGEGIDSDITIPVILNRICGVKDKIETAEIVDIAPTVATMLNIEKDDKWRGESLV